MHLHYSPLELCNSQSTVVRIQMLFSYLLFFNLCPSFSIPFAALTMQIFTRCGTNKELLSYLISLLIGVQEEA